MFLLSLNHLARERVRLAEQGRPLTRAPLAVEVGRLSTCLKVQRRFLGLLTTHRQLVEQRVAPIVATLHRAGSVTHHLLLQVGEVLSLLELRRAELLV